jgi:hypothetical protein
MTTPAVELVIEDRDRMSLLGLMLGDVIARNLIRPEGAALAWRLRGSVAVIAGRMAITLGFEGGRVVIRRGAEARPRARVSGSLDGLLQVSLGRSPIHSFLAGEVSIRGNPLFVLKLLPLMRAQPREKGDRR